MKVKQIIFNRSEYSNSEIVAALEKVVANTNFLPSTRETAQEIIDDTTGAVWFSGHDICDPEWKNI